VPRDHFRQRTERIAQAGLKSQEREQPAAHNQRDRDPPRDPLHGHPAARVFRFVPVNQLEQWLGVRRKAIVAS
jgi:hypothetical protein